MTVLLIGCGGRRSPTSITATAGTNVRLPARFTILASGRLSPPAVTVPAHVALELVVVSQSGRAHRALLHIPDARPLTVPPKGPAEQLIGALPAGTYPLSIDGRPRGTLRVRAR